MANVVQPPDRAPGGAPRPPPPAASGFEPLRRLYRRYAIVGGVFAAAGVLFAIFAGGGTVWPSSSLMICVGACLAALGGWGLRVGSAAQVLSTSLNLVQAGKLAEASALLDTLDSSTATGVVASRHIQRAMIAVRAGDLDAVLRHTDAVLAVPQRLLFRSTADVQRGSALGMRAWALAAKGDAEGATRAIEAVRASLVPTPESLAHAALAEAMVLERRGDRAALAALLRRERRLLMGGLDLRERAVVRAMQRMLTAAPRSVYRTAADVKKSDADQQPTISEWLDRVAPQLSAFAPRAPAAAPARAEAPPQLTPSPEAVAQVRAQAPPKRRFGPVQRVLVLWALLVAMFLMIYMFMTPAGSFPDPSSLPETMGPLSALWGVAVAGLLVGLFVWVVRRGQAQARTLHRLMSSIAAGEDVDRELMEMAESKQALTAAQAELLRASVADRRGELAEGIARVDAARARLQTEGARAAAAGMLAPALAGLRAHLLAAMGRTDEAAAELAQLPPDYLLLDRTRYAVQLTALLARGDVDGAARLVEATPQELSIGPRDELLRDLVRAATHPEGAGAAEIGRLRAELREDDESRRWIEKVAPALLARFDSATAPEDVEYEENPSEADDARAEDEAAAEEESAAEDASALAGARRS